MSTTNPLVIVIGAGASKEVNLPIGSELTTSIAEALTFPFDDLGNPKPGGDPQVRECSYKLAHKSNSEGTYREYLEASAQIKAAMPLAPSIDNFIDSRREDTLIATVGKLAIASCILKAERNSSLYVDRSNIYNTLDFAKVNRTWFAELFSIISQHCSREELPYRLSRLTVVSFNYDRCLKQYLHQALMTYYSMDRQQASLALARTSILYPYGSVSRVGFGGFESDFGEQLNADRLLQLSRNIRTFTESTIDQTEETTKIRSAVAGAQTLVFLGFAFHPLNLQLLYGSDRTMKGSKDCIVLGTALGVSDSNHSLVVEDLMQLGGYAQDNIHLHQNLTAGKLIAEYSRHLARNVQRAA